MTEIDAHLASQQDAKFLVSALPQVKTPDEILKMFFETLLIRIETLDRGQARDAAYEAVQGPSEGQTLTEHLAIKGAAAMEAVAPLLSPEDLRAFVTWFAGSKTTGPGFAQQLFAHIRDSKTDEALQQIVVTAKQIQERISMRDKRVFDRVEELPGSQRRLVKGFLLEAQWASTEGDGETARARLVQARRVATHLLRKKLRADKLFYNAGPAHDEDYQGGRRSDG